MSDGLEALRAALAGQYVVEKVLGEGGMATVYLARDVKHERAVAIKVLRSELAESVGAERFLREIKVAAKLQHPNILGLLDSGNAAGIVYYVMPYVEGESLRDRLDREKQLPVGDAIDLILEVADALHYAHGQGIIHRDIKPDNILLLKGSGRPLVMDFGIASAATASGADRLTQTGMSVGTPHYMSPEQASGADSVDGRADLYSLACVLYEMLAGQPPFDGPNTMAILARHAMEAVPSLQIVRNTIPDDVEDTILTALAKTPADRFNSVKSFAESLANADSGVVSSRTSTRAIPRRTMTHRIPTQQLPAYEPPKKRWPLVAGISVLLAAAVGGAFWLRSTGSGAVIAGADSDSRKLAVLYFEDASPQKDLGFLADGITEDLIRNFSGVPGVEVTSRNGVEPFRNTDVPPDSVARVLKVGTLVAGTVEPAGSGRIRVSVRLLDASGATFKRTSFEQGAADPLALRDSVAERVVVFLRERLGDEIRIRQQQASTRNADAWSLVQRAEQARKRWDAAVLGTDTTTAAAQSDAAADSLYTAAVGLDAAWATPWVGRSTLAYRHARLAGGAPLEAKPLLERALALADSALARDRSNADALEARGTARYFSWLLGLAPSEAAGTELLRQARTDLEAATKISPTQAGAWSALSHLYYNVEDGRTTDALIAAQRAYESDTWLSNANDILERQFLASYDLGQVTDAQRYCTEGGKRFPADPRFQSCRLWLMTMKGQTPDLAAAWTVIDGGNVVVPGRGSEDFQRRRARLAVAAAIGRAGLADSATHVATAAARVDADVDPRRELPLTLAFVLVTANDTAGAIDALKVYFAANPQARRGLAQDAGWWFRDYESVPAFKALFSGPAVK